MTFTLKLERDLKLKFLALGTSIILFFFANHKHIFLQAGIMILWGEKRNSRVVHTLFKKDNESVPATL